MAYDDTLIVDHTRKNNFGVSVVATVARPWDLPIHRLDGSYISGTCPSTQAPS